MIMKNDEHKICISICSNKIHNGLLLHTAESSFHSFARWIGRRQILNIVWLHNSWNTHLGCPTLRSNALSCVSLPHWVAIATAVGQISQITDEWPVFWTARVSPVVYFSTAVWLKCALTVTRFLFYCFHQFNITSVSSKRNRINDWSPVYIRRHQQVKRDRVSFCLRFA